jgi:hypothetical protein
MKSVQLLAFAIGLFFCLNATAQFSRSSSIKKQPARVINPGIRSVSVLGNFFNEGITTELLKQISEEQLEEIKQNCNEDNYPECIKKMLAYNPSDKYSDEKADKLIKSLTMYRIATFNNIRNGQNFGEESVLLVPADENIRVNGTCTFVKDFYIIIYTKGIKLLK